MRRRPLVVTMKKVLIVVVSFLVYVLILSIIEHAAEARYPTLPIPIGVLHGAVILGTMWLPVTLVGMEMAIENRGVKQKLIGFIALLMIMVPEFHAVERGINSIKDIKVGPQEIIVYDAEVERTSGGSRSGPHYFFIAKVQEDDTKRISMSKEQYNFCGELIETAEWKHGKGVRYRVRYFENTNILDSVEIDE